MPVLGICRGMQLLNVALGGTLDQHLPESLGGGDAPHRRRHLRRAPRAARCRTRSPARAAGAEGFVVRSHHHQGVERLGEGLRVSGWSAEDDMLEAIELPGKHFALGVIWHPEEDDEQQGDRGPGRGGARRGSLVGAIAPDRRNRE